jgi:hypothetical protein
MNQIRNARFRPLTSFFRPRGAELGGPGVPFVVPFGVLFVVLFVVLASASGCADRASALCSADPAPASSAVLVDVAIEGNAGGRPFALGTTVTSAVGVDYVVSSLRFYLSHLRLLDRDGHAVPAVLADADGRPLRYGVALVDYAKPDSRVLHVLVPPGRYESLSVSIGVPKDCSGGVGALNHEDASEQTFPLDVDTDMYWGWNPGYVFFKIEGSATTTTGPKTFLFHVGDDHRYVTATLPAALDVSVPAAHHLAMDVNRLFTTPRGELRPDMTGVVTPNISHGGQEADAVADNLSSSGVFQWKD